MARIRIWWTRKYQRSPNSEEFKSYTLFQLMTEFFEDYFEEKPEAMKGLDVPNSQFGDDVIDKWEREVEQGLTPDLLEDLSPEQARHLRSWSSKVGQLKRDRGGIGFNPSKPESSSESVYREEF